MIYQIIKFFRFKNFILFFRIATIKFFFYLIWKFLNVIDNFTISLILFIFFSPIPKKYLIKNKKNSVKEKENKEKEREKERILFWVYWKIDSKIK
ncbi:hypothetical protein HPHPA17_1559 [Helicobacter pylori Hp A-17]|nr:hypothetical protein HPHPA17_1559 [Helicobacter pylori Hp A-17]